MYFETGVQEIPISLVKKDNFFQFSDENLPFQENLKLAITHLGILKPLVVQPLPGVYCRIVDGFKRFQIAERIGFSSIPARILRNDLCAHEIVHVLLFSTLAKFSLIEKVRLTRIMVDLGLSIPAICKDFGSFIEAPSPKLVEDYLQISQYIPCLLLYILRHGLSLKQAVACKGLSEKEQELVALIGTSLSLKGYDMYTMVTDLREIATRGKNEIEAVIKELKIVEVAQENKFSRSQKIEKIKSIVRARRYPCLTQINKTLTKLSKKLELAHNVKISWDENLEGELKLSLGIQEMDDVVQMASIFSQSNNYALLSELLKVYHEGLSGKKNKGRHWGTR